MEYLQNEVPEKEVPIDSDVLLTLAFPVTSQRDVRKFMANSQA